MHKRLLIAVILGIFLSSTTVIVINFAVDPYGLYRVIDKSGFNQQKEGVRNKIRLVKFLEIPLRKPRTILLGSSRTHDGIDPQDKILNTAGFQPVYNLGIDMARIKEEKAFLEYAIANSDIKRVIFGLDFFMFNAEDRINPSFDLNHLNRRAGGVDYLKATLLSVEALNDSIKTIRISAHDWQRREFLSNGFRPGKMVFYKVKNYNALHYNTNYTFLTPYDSKTKYYSHFSLDKEVFNDFNELLQLCKNHDIDLKLYISPAHANLDGEALRASGHWELMRSWKREIVNIVSKSGYELWDFSGYNSVTTEQISDPMSNYWDSSHFTEKIGGDILRRMLGKSEGVPSDFGLLLNQKNIEVHLKQIELDRTTYIFRNRLSMVQTLQEFEDIVMGAPLDLSRIATIFKEKS